MTNTWNWVSIAIFLALGFYSLFGARRMQKQAIKASEDLKSNPFRSYIRSPTYLTVARIIGASSIVVALLLALALMLGKQLPN